MTQFAPDITDAALIQLIRDENLEALGVLFDRYYQQIYRAAVSITQDDAAAEDITQDCFLKIHRYANRIDTSLPLAPWLYRVTVNLSYTWVSRRKKRRVSLEAIVDRLMSPLWQSPDHMAEYMDMQEQVRQAIKALPFNQRVVVVLYYINGLNLEEIAETLSCPVGTVKSRLHYARENLRHCLDNVNWSQEMGITAHGYAG